MQKDENGHVPNASTILASQLVLLKVWNKFLSSFGFIQHYIEVFALKGSPVETEDCSFLVAISGFLIIGSKWIKF